MTVSNLNQNLSTRSYITVLLCTSWFATLSAYSHVSKARSAHPVSTKTYKSVHRTRYEVIVKLSSILLGLPNSPLNHNYTLLQAISLYTHTYFHPEPGLRLSELPFRPSFLHFFAEIYGCLYYIARVWGIPKGLNVHTSKYELKLLLHLEDGGDNPGGRDYDTTKDRVVSYCLWRIVVVDETVREIWRSCRKWSYIILRRDTMTCK